MSDKNILLDALDTHWRRLRKEWHQNRKKDSEAAVHDLRVASRRLLAVLDTLESLVGDSGIKESRRPVKKLLQSLSSLRDAHVQAAYISKMIRSFPELKPFKNSFDKKQQNRVKKRRKLFAKPLGLGHAITKAKRRAKKGFDTSAIVGVVDKRFHEVLELAELVDRFNTKTIHEMRLSFKRFRYSAELVQPLIRRKLSRSRLKQFHAFQAMMGDIQDMEVLSSKLVKWVGKNQESAPGLKPVLEELARRKDKNIDVFMESFPKVRSFWKL
jgi:CHAD domain-containing protein